MFAIARIQAARACGIGRRGLAAAAFLGFTQFCVNFNAVYLAERHITSGVVATVFALAADPEHACSAGRSSASGRARRFVWSSLVAVAGIALLFVHELQRASRRRRPDRRRHRPYLARHGLGDRAPTSIQARREIRHLPLFSLLAWSMAAGALIDALDRARLRRAAGVRPSAGLLGGPALPRAGRVGAHLQPLLPGGAQDRPGQGGLFERARAGDRDGLSRPRSKAIAGRR